jgi:hypothetical protein
MKENKMNWETASNSGYSIILAHDRVYLKTPRSRGRFGRPIVYEDELYVTLGDLCDHLGEDENAVTFNSLKNRYAIRYCFSEAEIIKFFDTGKVVVPPPREKPTSPVAERNTRLSELLSLEQTLREKTVEPAVVEPTVVAEAPTVKVTAPVIAKPTVAVAATVKSSAVFEKKAIGNGMFVLTLANPKALVFSGEDTIPADLRAFIAQ